MRSSSSRTIALAFTTVLGVASALGATSCGDSGDRASSSSPATDPTTTTTAGAGSGAATSSTTPDPVATPTTMTTVAPSTTTTERPPTTQPVPTGSPDLATGIYWTRPVGGDPVSIGSYVDPTSGTVPFLVYGSLTNTGATAIANPSVTSVWRNGAGEVVAVFAGRVVDPRGNTVTSIAPGQTVDVVVVVDPDDAGGLDALSPELIGTAG